MKILLVHNYYRQRGGEDVYFDSIAKLLKEKGHNVITFTTSSKNAASLPEKIHAAFSLFGDKNIHYSLEEIVIKHKPDIAHFHNIFPYITPLAYSTCKKHGVPVIQRIPHYRFICPKATLFRNGKICELCTTKKFAYPAIMHRCYNGSFTGSAIISAALSWYRYKKWLSYVDSFIFQAKFVREYYRSKIDLPLDKTSLLPHFVPNNSYKRFDKSNHFIYVGRLSEEKGIIPLLEVVCKLPEIKLLVVGDGPLQKQVEAFTRYPNIVVKNRLSRNKVLELMSKALCTIIPSPWYETGPLVLMESYSVGTPVVAPRLGVFKDEVIEGKTGFMYSPQNIFELAKLLPEIQKTRKTNVHVSYCKNAYSKYRKKYTQEQHYRLLLQIYAKAIKYFHQK